MRDSLVTSGAIASALTPRPCYDYFRAGKRHGAVSRVAIISRSATGIDIICYWLLAGDCQFPITNSLLYHLPIHNPPLSLLADQIVAHPQVFVARRNRLIAIEHFGFF